MPIARPRLKSVARAALAAGLLHVTFTVLLFGAPALALAGGGALFLVFAPQRWRRRARVVASLTCMVGATLGVLQLTAELNTLSCRVRRALPKSPKRCREVPSPRDREAIYSARQAAAIRWANLHMALGGYVVGFREVARETLELDFRATEQTRRRRERPVAERLAFCRAGAATGEPLVRDSDFAMESRNVRRIVAELVDETPLGETRRAPHVIKNGYANPYTTYRVALALLVPDATLSVTRLDANTVDVEWRGGIQYPPASAFTLPLPIGAPFVVDEAVFCGLQMDGDFVPYTMVWRWTLDAKDPRLVR